MLIFSRRFTEISCWLVLGSADINPIGGICKGDLKSFLLWAADHMKMPSLKTVVAAPPTAELEPITNDYKQEDEVDMGMSYKELGVFGMTFPPSFSSTSTNSILVGAKRPSEKDRSVWTSEHVPQTARHVE